MTKLRKKTDGLTKFVAVLHKQEENSWQNKITVFIEKKIKSSEKSDQ